MELAVVYGFKVGISLSGVVISSGGLPATIIVGWSAVSAAVGTTGSFVSAAVAWTLSSSNSGQGAGQSRDRGNSREGAGQSLVAASGSGGGGNDYLKWLIDIIHEALFEGCSNAKKEIKKLLPKAKVKGGKLSGTTLYKVKDLSCWISKDRSGHGGSCFKKWIEKGRGLEFVGSLDKGMNLIQKHESCVRLFISFSDIRNS